MVGAGGAALDVVTDLFDPEDVALGRAADEGALPARAPRQLGGDVAELRGEILVDVKDVHGVVRKDTRDTPHHRRGRRKGVNPRRPGYNSAAPDPRLMPLALSRIVLPLAV